MTTSTITATATQFTASADGTRIAYEATGTGPALVLVDGAMCQRSMGPSRGLAKALAGTFAVHAYDRRGRGESDAGASPYHLDREIEDLRAVIDAAGGSAHVFGASSGAALALEAEAGASRSTGSQSTRCRSSWTTRTLPTLPTPPSRCSRWLPQVAAARPSRPSCGWWASLRRS